MARAADPALARSAALALVRALRDAGHIAYFAGGCVRDELLGLRPTDYDVATDATPDRIQSLFKRTAAVGASFGVVLVKPGAELGLEDNAATIEVATFRSDGPYSDRRRPDRIAFSDPKSDAERRDFTINALFLDPNSDSNAAGPRGRVIDYVNGQADLDAKIIRAVGDPEARLAEDHLRALRAVRFAARFGFEIEPRTASAIAAHARDLKGVSRERIGEELRRILTDPAAARGTELLQQLALDAPVLDDAHGDRPCPVLSLVAREDEARDFPLRLAAWLIDRGMEPANTRAIATRVRGALSLSNDEHDALRGCLEMLPTLRHAWLIAPIATQKRLAATHAHGDFARALRLMHAIDSRLAASIQKRVADLLNTPSKIRPEPLVTGDDLIALGLKPGKAFKTILDDVYDAQLEDRVATREAGIALALELARSLGI
jgi:tRNA nucleotidyltransferase/poly(A) polymerase